MNEEQIGIKTFGKEDAIVIRRILMVGSTENGEHLGMEIETEDGTLSLLLFPFFAFPKLMLSLMTAGGLAHRDQLARFAGHEAALSATGLSAFRPTGYHVGRMRLTNGEDVVLMRLKKGELPILDVTLPVQDAKLLGRDVTLEAAKEPLRKKPSH